MYSSWLSMKAKMVVCAPSLMLSTSSMLYCLSVPLLKSRFCHHSGCLLNTGGAE